jgi:regulator of sirC expression with transglutaminase-like and TPR domain
MVAAPVLQEIEKIKRTVWLELNNYLTSLEQANIINNILFNYYRLMSVPIEYNHPDDFLVNKVLEHKKGNALSNGILYQVLCRLLDINAKIISIPNQIIIAFYRFDYSDKSVKDSPQDKINFFIDGASGFAYSKKDIAAYLKRIGLENNASVYQSLNTKKLIQILLKEFSKCFTSSVNRYKQNELLALAGLLDD